MSTSESTQGSIDHKIQDGVLIIRINRPAKRNGFTPAMMNQLSLAYTLLDDEPSLRVGVVCAEGDHFTGGLDLPTFAGLMQRGERAIADGQVDPFDLGMQGYRRRVKPLVMAVKGITFTLGIELMLAADVVIAADNCRFSQLEVKRGIMATGGATLRMSQRAGAGNALMHLLTGDEFDSDEALRLNFVQKVVPAGEELNEALRIARLIAEQAPLAVIATRQSVMQCIEEGPQAAVDAFEATQQRLSNSQDAAEGVRSFVEKRHPRFTGT